MPLLSGFALPKQLYAVVARPPIYGYRIDRLDSTAAWAVSGMVKIQMLETTPHTQGGVALIGKDHETALKARDALRVSWQAPPFPISPSPALLAEIGPVQSLLNPINLTWSPAALVLEADMLSHHMNGTPVKLMWTPADDIPLAQFSG